MICTNQQDCNHQSEFIGLYYSGMMKGRDLPQANLARNLRFLMDKHGHKSADLAAKPNIPAQTTHKNI